MMIIMRRLKRRKRFSDELKLTSPIPFLLSSISNNKALEQLQNCLDLEVKSLTIFAKFYPSLNFSRNDMAEFDLAPSNPAMDWSASSRATSWNSIYFLVISLV